jgi:hypothetical protein
MTKQKKNFKTSAYTKKNTDLMLKMIKKAKISRVRVPFFSLSPQKIPSKAEETSMLSVQKLLIRQILFIIISKRTKFCIKKTSESGRVPQLFM